MHLPEDSHDMMEPSGLGQACLQGLNTAGRGNSQSCVRLCFFTRLVENVLQANPPRQQKQFALTIHSRCKPGLRYVDADPHQAKKNSQSRCASNLIRRLIPNEVWFLVRMIDSIGMRSDNLETPPFDSMRERIGKIGTWSGSHIVLWAGKKEIEK